MIIDPVHWCPLGPVSRSRGPVVPAPGVARTAPSAGTWTTQEEGGGGDGQGRSGPQPPWRGQGGVQRGGRSALFGGLGGVFRIPRCIVSVSHPHTPGAPSP